MQSKFMTEQILGKAQEETPELEGSTLTATETVTINEVTSSTTEVAQVDIVFSQPITYDQEMIDGIVQDVQDSVISGEMGLLQKITKGKSTKAKKTGSTSTSIGKYKRQRKTESEGTFQSQNGRFISEVNLRNLMQQLMFENIVNKMHNPTGGELRYRTGRFSENVFLRPMVLRGNTVSLFYTYMVRPYSVFDPKVSDYHNLSSEARNPQRLISNAIQSQARTLMLSRYNIEISQHWRRTG